MVKWSQETRVAVNSANESKGKRRRRGRRLLGKMWNRHGSECEGELHE